jgi:hypothetical protein
MALRNKLADRSQPFLPPGSQIRHVYYCQTGPSPWFFLLTYLIIFAIQFRIVVVTDEAIYVLRSSKFLIKPKELVATLPRQTQLGPVSGLWAKTDLLGERHWVHKRFHKDVQAADAVAFAAGPGAAPYGQPAPGVGPAR